MLCLFFALCVLRLATADSFTIILDTTYSMRDDVEILKSNLRSVVDALRLSPHVEEFILVPFNDPDVGLPVITKVPEDFLGAINSIRTSGGTDCPENTLAGIRKGLEISKPDSNIFVFTDAFANDFNQVSVVKGLCRTTRSRVTIFLSGFCEAREGTVEIYKNITDHCSGAVFQLGLDNFRKAFQLMKEITKVEWNRVQNYSPLTDPYEFQISFDTFTSNAMVMASGKGASVTIHGCFECEDVLRDPKSFHILRVRPYLGTFRATLRCETCTSLAVYKRLDLKFSYGFSTRPVKNLKETTQKPIPGIDNYITIFVDNESSVSVNSMELQSDGSPVSELQLSQVSPGNYYTTAYIYAGKRYRIIVKGYDTTTSQQLTGSSNILQPQTTGFAPASMSPAIEIIKPDNTLLEYGASITLASRVTAYPKPDIWWEDENERKLNSDNILLETPAIYISYITTNVISNTTLFCKSKNYDGEASQEISLFVNRTAILEFVQKPKDQTIEYGKEVKIHCEVNSYPEASITWYHNETLLEDSDNIKINNDDNALVIQKMGLEDVGDYKCEADNKVQTKSVTAVIEISDLEYPEMATDTSEISIKLGRQASIKCSIIKGKPTPEVTWQYKSDDSDEFGELPTDLSSSTDDKPTRSKRDFFDYLAGSWDTKEEKSNDKSLTLNTNKAGTYQCKGSNILGENAKEIVVKVQVPPEIRNNEDEIITVKKNNRVELSCEVSGTPRASVRWEISHGDDFVPLSDRHHIDDRNTLRFNALQKDSGDYHCIAENEFGRAEKRYSVIVLVRPYIEAPEPRVVNTAVGSTISLPCNVQSGSPPPSTWWEFSAPDSPPTTLSRGNSTNVLVLRRVTKAQEGSYRCIARNDLGVDSIQIMVNVQ
ncbi:hemicentin-1-like [Plodia interpunctella]|uniref:hemicentin-1-like n=1 Tax=Plodia interpunctella TaxID=58824 RepID=UPI00236764B5|nr:hemicentin-1-like [Plodia interpunctella]